MDESILEYICCPIGKAPLIYRTDFLECSGCGAKFPILDNIPSLIIEEAILPEGVSSITELNCQKRMGK